MKVRNAGRLLVTSTAAVVAISVMGGALGTSVERFNYCMENQADTDDIATRIHCCKEAGGAWVEIYDPDGNVVDAFCDGGEEVYEPEENAQGLTVAPGALGNVVGTAVVATVPSPSPVAVGDQSAPPPAPASADEGTNPVSLEGSAPGAQADSGSLGAASSEPAEDSSPAPKKIKRKHRRHRRR